MNRDHDILLHIIQTGLSLEAQNDNILIKVNKTHLTNEVNILKVCCLPTEKATSRKLTINMHTFTDTTEECNDSTAT